MSICGHPDCGASEGIHEGVTFGRGELSEHGYWEVPCNECARKFERLHPEYGSAWPFERNEKDEILQKSIIYTVGHTDSYLQYFKEQEVPMKAVGGSVWKTREEAEEHCEERFSVFGVFADWDKETISKNLRWNDLLIDAPLVKLENEKVVP